jgi:hypothetical protein
VSYERIKQAALNNALWCDTVCRSHGTPGEFLAGLWLNSHETPRFYPNVVTLEGSEGAAMQMAQIKRLLQADLPAGWAVKDSFCTLDLAPLGFRALFEAAWIYRSAHQPRPPSTGNDVRWSTVSSVAALAAWEEAWGGDGQPRIFLPALLADESIAIIAAYRGEQIIAGAIANRTGEVVGLSNVFTPEENAEAFWAGCLARAMDVFPALPLVGYERGEALDQASALGFERIGPLRVWVCA